jgi:O-acetyl-ADP-ribose deacetylase (regulator of RNase III)
MALPAVSTGIYGWPLDDAARIAVETVAASSAGVDEAAFVLFGSTAYAAFVTALDRVETKS